MCGICGVIGVDRPDEAEAIVRRMVAALRHRGPDDEGVLATLHATLGIRRLSIIDLAGGHQPVFNEDRSIAVVFNGEIYNFQELRRTLEAQGHVFRSRSDTEAIVHAYEAWGENCVQHLRGMFAFAVLDQRRSPDNNSPRVFLARDRLGIKPLYYTRANEVLLFASEVRALLASGRIEPRLSRAGLKSYLAFGSLAEPMTLIEGLFSLPPGHCLLVQDAAHPGAIDPAPYWSLDQAVPGPTDTPPRDLPTAAQGLRPLLEDAVRSHLVADVPLGLFLSSGLDSTAIASLASREQKGIHTFTVVFPEQEFSEALLARRTAERLGTLHQELPLTAGQTLERLEDAIGALDQPTMDGMNTYFVSWVARQVGLKVALSGLGGDEVFGGYSTFDSTPRAARVAELGRWLPRTARSAAASALVSLGDGRHRADARRKLAALWRSPDAFPHAYFYVRALFTPEQAAKLLRGAPLEAVQQPWRAWLEETTRQAERLDSFAAVSCLEMRSYMVNTLLRDTDAVSMSHSLEVRVPLLDHKLVEFVLRLPRSAKHRRGIPKALLIESLGDLLPEDVVRQRKRTFTFPWERWLRGALGGRVAAGLADLTPALRPFLDQEAVCRIWQDFLAGRTSWSRPWSLYVLNCWCAWHLDAGVASGERARPAAALSGAASSATSGVSE